MMCMIAGETLFIFMKNMQIVYLVMLRNITNNESGFNCVTHINKFVQGYELQKRQTMHESETSGWEKRLMYYGM